MRGLKELLKITKMKLFLRKNIILFFITGLGVLCWFKLIFLRGIWWDDWAWIWHYYGSKGFSEFILPFKSLRHEFEAYLFFSYFKLLDIVPLMAFNIWSILKIIIFTLNSVLIYFISKSILSRKSLLPVAITVTYLTSPIVLNLCLVELDRRVYLFLFLLSMLCSVGSVNKSKFKPFYYLSALFFACLAMFGLESFIFFDISRFVIIFYLFSKRPDFNFIKNLKKTVLYWLPFILAGTAILIYRTGLFFPRSGVYAHTYDIKVMPVFKYAGFLLFGYVKSFIFILTSYVWSFVGRHGAVTIEPFITLQAVIVAILGLWIIFSKSDLTGNYYRNSGLFLEAKITALFGVLLVLAALFPYIMVYGGYSMGLVSRHGLTASIGFSVFISALFLMLYYRGIISTFFLYFLFGFVIFLGVFQCNMAIKFYNKDWEQQRSFWQEFIKQVPDLKDKTFLLVDMPRESAHYLGSWRGGYEFAAPFNLLYAKSRNKDQINRLNAESVDILLDNSYRANLDKQEVRYDSFKGAQSYYPKNLIIASYHGEVLSLNKKICRDGRYCTKDIKSLMPRIAGGQILDKAKVTEFPFRWIMGLEPGNPQK